MNELNDAINNAYFEWMYDLVCGSRYSKHNSYRKLLMFLHNAEFAYLLEQDKNRAEDGIELRYRFCQMNDYEDVMGDLDGPCSILEMMIALAIRCEEHIMEDSDIGDRTGQWFWTMVTSLGLGGMSDDRFDRHSAERIIVDFLNHDYEPNGRGGLFTVKHSKQDLRDIEIWYQMHAYLDTIM